MVCHPSTKAVKHCWEKLLLKIPLNGGNTSESTCVPEVASVNLQVQSTDTLSRVFHHLQLCYLFFFLVFLSWWSSPLAGFYIQSIHHNDAGVEAQRVIQLNRMKQFSGFWRVQAFQFISFLWALYIDSVAIFFLSSTIHRG